MEFEKLGVKVTYCVYARHHNVMKKHDFLTKDITILCFSRAESNPLGTLSTQDFDALYWCKLNGTKDFFKIIFDLAGDGRSGSVPKQLTTRSSQLAVDMVAFVPTCVQ